MPSHSFLPAISTFISTTEMADIPPEAIDRAKHVVLDCVGAIVGGMAEPDMQRLTAMPHPGGGAPILGTNMTADIQTAAMLNGMSGTVLEMDEGSQFARGHPGMHVFPALLAAARMPAVPAATFFVPLSSAMTWRQGPVSGQNFA